MTSGLTTAGKLLLLMPQEGLSQFSDNFNRADGAVSNHWIGAGSISGNKLVITPTLGTDLFQAGKGTFDSGTGGWGAYGTNTRVNDAGQLKITYGNNANGALLTLQASTALTANLTVDAWYQLDIDARVSAGASVLLRLLDNVGLSVYYGTVTDTNLTHYQIVFRCRDATSTTLNFDTLAAGNSVWIDNLTLKPLTFNTAILSTPLMRPGKNPKVTVSILTSTLCGVVSHLDNPLNPQNFILGYADRGVVNHFYLVKCVAGVFSAPLILATGVYVDGAPIEIRNSATNTFQLWFNNAQVGTDQTISDASIVQNAYYGVFDTNGGNSLDSFFVGSAAVVKNVVFLGGSITNGVGSSSAATISWRALTGNWLEQNHLEDNWPQRINAGVGGTPSWYGLIRLATDVLAYSPSVVFLEFAVNDPDNDATGSRVNGFAPAAEALIRRLRSALPNVMIVIAVFTWPDSYSYMIDIRRTTRDKWVALASRYGCALMRLDLELETLIGSPTPDDSQITPYFFAAGDVHPNDTGYNAAFLATTPLLASINANTHDAALYFADEADYEAAPIIRVGTDNDGETGTWTTPSGTSRQSTVANSTIKWTGTFCSFGWDTNFDVGAGTVGWDLDGGGYTNIDLSAQKVADHVVTNFAAGVHTITLKVISGTVKINRFLAI